MDSHYSKECTYTKSKLLENNKTQVTQYFLNFLFNNLNVGVSYKFVCVYFFHYFLNLNNVEKC